jgi:hypothetical protein
MGLNSAMVCYSGRSPPYAARSPFAASAHGS